MIPVLKPTPPSIEKWTKYLQMSYDQSTFSNGGPCVKLLESRLKDYLGLEHEPVLMCNATIALTVVMQAMELPGSAALMPSFTFAATPHSALNAGCYPALVDIEDDLHASLESLNQVYNHECKSLVVVQALGYSCDYKKYEEFAKDHDLKLIFDSAACLGASYSDGKKVGSAGDCEIFSLHITKTFGIGEGALVTSKNKEFLERCRQITNFGFNKDGLVETSGVNAKCSEFHAAVGLAVLDEIDLKMGLKTTAAEKYNNLLKDLPVKVLSGNSAHQVYPVIFESKEVRDRVKKSLQDENIMTRIYYIPTHHQPYFSPLIRNTLPKTDYYYERILCIPFFECISSEEQELIVQIISKNL